MAPALRPLDLAEAREGATTFLVPRSEPTKGPKAREGVPFYNPAMRLSRDLSVLVARAFVADRPGTTTVCDAMSSLGARGLRLAREVPRVHVLLNDPNLDAIHLAKQNADRLGLNNVDVRMGRLEPALADTRFDWIDIDPFGSPAAYLDAATSSVTDGGVLAVTATDKATLCGVHPDVCLRRYGARPLHAPVMWEVATRILMGAVARAAGRRDRWIQPLLAHSTNHYVRVYCQVRDGAEASNRQAGEYAYAWIGDDLARHFEPQAPPGLDHAGPLWAGPLTDPGFAGRVLGAVDSSTPRDARRLLEGLREEADAPPLYYTIDEFTRKVKSNAPKLERLVDRLRSSGHRAARTHFTPRGFKTDAGPSEILGAIRA